MSVRMDNKLYDAAQPLQWAEAPERTQWGAGMMEALVALNRDHTLRLYAEREALHLVPGAISSPQAAQPLTADQVFANNEVMAINAELGLRIAQLMDLVRAVERAHGIGAQP